MFLLILGFGKETFINLDEEGVLGKVVRFESKHKGGGVAVYEYKYDGVSYEGSMMNLDKVKVGDKIWIEKSTIIHSVASPFPVFFSSQIFLESDSVEFFKAAGINRY